MESNNSNKESLFGDNLQRERNASANASVLTSANEIWISSVLISANFKYNFSSDKNMQYLGV